MNGKGDWFKFHRSYADCEALGHGTDWNLVGAWVAIIAMARYEPTTFAGESIQRGEFGFTYRMLQESWGKSPNKLKAIFDHFQGHEMIEVRHTRRCSVCRVLNYERYQSSNASDNATNNASDNGNKNIEKVKKESARARFKVPSVEEVKDYCQERSNGVDAQRFHDYYQANGWTQGRGKPLKDWQAAVRTWERNGVQNGNQPTTAPRKMLKPPVEV